METDPKPKRQTDPDPHPPATSSVQLRDRRPHSQDSPLSSMSSLSSLSRGFSPERVEFHPEPVEPETSHGSPPLDPLPDLTAVERVTADRVTAERVTSPTPVPMVNRYVREETTPIKKADPGAQDGFVRRPVEEVRTSGGEHVRRRSVRVNREGSMKKIALGFRIFELLFCLVSLSVMATDKRQGWALDSYYRYKEFRYSMGVNVVGFAYSVLQGCDLVYQLATGSSSHQRHYLRYYFDFAMDQMLSYLLISSGSSAATRVDDWKSNWGADKFPELATASVGCGFAAFVAFAFSSVVSGYSLYTATSS